MSAKFDLSAAERVLASSEALAEVELEHAMCMFELRAALSEIRRLLGVVYEAHQTISRELGEDDCDSCPDCAAFRSTRETT